MAKSWEKLGKSGDKLGKMTKVVKIGKKLENVVKSGKKWKMGKVVKVGKSGEKL